MAFWLVLCLVFGLIYLLLKPHSYWKNKGVSQSRPWILIGDSWGMVLRTMSVAEMSKYFYDMFPNVRYYGIYQFLMPKLAIRDPELIRRVTVKDFDHFTDHVAMVDPTADKLFAKNLLMLKGDEWRQMRSTLTGSFTSSKMKIMFNLMTEAAQDFVEHFKKEDAVEVEMKDAYLRFTIDIIATTSFGIQVNSLVDKDNDFFRLGKEISSLGFKSFLKLLVFWTVPSLYKFLKFRMLRKEVDEFFSRIIEDTVKTREEKGIYRPDMLQILIEARKGTERKEETNVADVGFAATEEFTTAKSKFNKEITIEDITAQAVIFFFAGVDSVSSVMTFTSYELALNPDIQEKLREEIRETLKKGDGKITYEGIATMKCMDMVITESLRKWPPFVTIGRECTKTYVIDPVSPQEKKLVIPKGTAVVVPLYGIHHDPKYYPNPEKFDPERFHPENRSKLTPYTFLGFGCGPRACLGSRFALLEIKVIMFHLLSNFEFVITEKTQIPIKISKKLGINIRPEKGLWLKLRKI